MALRIPAASRLRCSVSREGAAGSLAGLRLAANRSPDGRKIAFASHRSGGMQIFVMNADGTGVVNLTNDSTAIAFGATWSPDGRRIAFRGFRNGNVDIFVMNADGSGVVNVTNHPANDDAPNWSPP
jgi:TolB protein